VNATTVRKWGGLGGQGPHQREHGNNGGHALCWLLLLLLLQPDFTDAQVLLQPTTTFDSSSP